MTGSVFIVHSKGWSCSNDAILDFHSFTERDENEKIIKVNKTQTLTIRHIFNAESPIQIEDKCEIVLLTDNDQKKFGFIGKARSITKETVIINIFTKTERISEILSNITPKNLED